MISFSCFSCFLGLSNSCRLQARLYVGFFLAAFLVGMVLALVWWDREKLGPGYFGVLISVSGVGFLSSALLASRLIDSGSTLLENPVELLPSEVSSPHGQTLDTLARLDTPARLDTVLSYMSLPEIAQLGGKYRNVNLLYPSLAADTKHQNLLMGVFHAMGNVRVFATATNAPRPHEVLQLDSDLAQQPLQCDKVTKQFQPVSRIALEVLPTLDTEQTHFLIVVGIQVKKVELDYLLQQKRELSLYTQESIDMADKQNSCQTKRNNTNIISKDN